MQHEVHTEKARERAEAYAPQPTTSRAMYGVVGVSLAVLAGIGFTRYFDLDPLAHPLWVAAALTAVFAGSMILRKIRSRRHARAHQHEYEQIGKNNT